MHPLLQMPISNAEQIHRSVLVIFICVLSFAAFAQPKPPKLPKFNKNKEKEVFLKKQWFLGFKAGANYSGVDVLKEYSVLSPSNYDISETRKRYDAYQDLGAHATIEATFYFTGLSLSFQPTYRQNTFSYSNSYAWIDSENPNNILELNYYQQQNLDYFDFPVLAKYEKMFNKFSPYVQAGIYSSIRLNATKSVDVHGTDYASGGKNQFKDETIIVGAKDLYAKNHWGLLGGVGLYYNLGNVRLNLDIQYRKGMSNITSTKNRYSNNQLSGVGDTLDDMRLNSVLISAGSIFPLRFLSRNFRSTDNRK
jgi:hypothetical protein